VARRPGPAQLAPPLAGNRLDDRGEEFVRGSLTTRLPGLAIPLRLACRAALRARLGIYLL
jgi:hypothetical protein